MMSGGEEDMAFDQEDNQNSVDDFEKQLQQQEKEMQEQIRLQEQESLKAGVTAADGATDGDSIPTPVAAPTLPTWQQESTVSEDMAVDDGTEDISMEDTNGSHIAGVKRPNSPGQENGGDDSMTVDGDSSEPQSKQPKLDDLTKLWQAVNENNRDFTAWTNLLQHVDQQSELEAGRDAYAAFFARYPYCYGYWKKFSDLEKRKGTKESTLKVFELGIVAIPLSVDLWVHYMDYITTTFKEETEEEFVREQFERAVAACGIEFKSDRMWDAYINWENTGKRWQQVTAVYDRLLATPVAKYLQHWTRFQDHVKRHSASEVVSSSEYMTLHRSLNADAPPTEEGAAEEDEAPPGVEDDPTGAGDGTAAAALTPANMADTEILKETDTLNLTDPQEEENKSIQQLIISSREKVHQATIEQTKQRWTFEDAIKRPYFHVKPLERSQLQAWRDYLEFEVKQGNETRTRTLFERCLIAAALYEEFWMRYLHYLNTISTVSGDEIRTVYERACNIHLKEKLKPHLSWANFEEEQGNIPRALELLTEIQDRLPEAQEPHLQAAAVERRQGHFEKAEERFLKSIDFFKNKEKLTQAYVNIIVRYARFLSMFRSANEKALDYIQTVITENTPSEGKLSDSEQMCMETLLWALIDRAMTCTPPKFTVVSEALSLGTTAQFPPRSRLLFANRYNQFVAECGPPNITVSQATKLLRELQQEIRQTSQEEATEVAASDKGDESADTNASSENRREKRAKSHSDRNQQQPPPPVYSQQNGNVAAGGQNYNANNAAGGGYHNQQQQYPPQNQGSGPPQHPPQQPPPPQNQGGYGGYNQNYQQGYPQQQYQGWGYPQQQQQQQQGYGGYNQQNWSGYPNYYGQR